MPTYSYRCTECDRAFDIQQAFTDDTLTTCPTCGGVLRKVFSPIGVSFTGSGFYRNDSRAKPTEKSSSDKTGAEKTSSEKSSTEKSGSEKSADKPAKKEKTATTSTPSTSGGTGKAATSSATSQPS